MFQLGYLQVFLVFAPVAMCARLTRNPATAIVLAVGLGLYVSWRLIARADVPPGNGLALQILLSRAVGDGLCVWFYQRGGVWVASWIGLVVHLRHLPALLAVH